MRDLRPLLVALLVVPGALIGIWIGTGSGQGTAPPRAPAPADAVQQAQTPQAVPVTRPEQRKTPHDLQDATKGAPPAASFEAQPDKGQALGFDFARDPLNAKRPMQPPEEIVQADVAAKPAVTAAQRRLLESRYDLTPRLDPQETMSRGKPLAVGPTEARRVVSALGEMGPGGGGFPFLSQASLTAAYLAWAVVWVAVIWGLTALSFQRRDAGFELLLL